jgi:hypothetical protein
MQVIRKRFVATTLISFAMAVLAPGARAQTLTVAVNTHAVNFALTKDSATNAGSNAVVTTTTWNGLGRGGGDLTVYCYFANANSALTGPGGNIPSSAFSISVNGTAYRDINFTEPSGGANAGRHIVFDIAIGNAGTRSDSTVFNMDLSTGTLPQLPPGTYTGILSIRAQIL